MVNLYKVLNWVLKKLQSKCTFVSAWVISRRNLINVLSVLFFCTVTSYTQAQSLNKNLEWIQQNQTEIFLPRSFSNSVVHGSQIEFTNRHIKLVSNNGAQTVIPWKKLIYIEETDYGEDGELELVSREKLEGHYIGITLSIQDDGARSKFLKYFRKLARKRGAKLLKKDLLEHQF